MSTTIFEIKVLGFSSDESKEHYTGNTRNLSPYKFRIIYSKETGLYQVICRMSIKKIDCGSFLTEKDANNFITKAMKEAMKGQLLVRECIECGHFNYYRSFCEKCGLILEPWGWYVNPSLRVEHL